MSSDQSLTSSPASLGGDGWDARVVELICSRLCHDLAGPIGAIRNGLELIEEMGEETGSGGGFGTETIELIGHSAEQAGRRLQLYRLAYGVAGAEGGHSFETARRAARDWLDGGRTTLNWGSDRPPAAAAKRPGAVKLLLNLILIADEALPQGGVIEIDGSGDAATGRLSVIAHGPMVRLSPETAQAIAATAPSETLAARTIHAYATGRFAAGSGIELIVQAPLTSDSRLTMMLAW